MMDEHLALLQSFIFHSFLFVFLILQQLLLASTIINSIQATTIVTINTNLI